MEKLKSFLAILIVILFLPYVITILFNGKTENESKQNASEVQIIQIQKENTTEQIDINEYIIGLLASQMPVSYEPEALRAQSVIIRTNLMKELGSNDLDNYVFEHNYLSYLEMEELWGYTLFSEYYNKLKAAVLDTEGEVLLHEGGLIDASYHSVSAGSTRAGEEVFGAAGYSYLQSVVCEYDIEAEDYLQLSIFNEEELLDVCRELNPEIDIQEGFLEALSIDETDAAGYVKRMSFNGKSISGEEFRQKLGLNSSCMSIQEYNGKIRITTKGLGHGLGMSQFGANKMAQNGKNYKEILNYFYSNISIEVIQ